jgi:hypothetical protein
MVIQKIVIKQRKQRCHTRYKNYEDNLHDEYFSRHVNTHRRVNAHVIDMLESIGEL